MQLAAARPVDLTADVDEAVFRKAYIPRKLEEVEHFERDAQRLKDGDQEGIYFQAISGLGGDGRVAADGVPKVLVDALAQLRAVEVSRDGGVGVARGSASASGADQGDTASEAASSMPGSTVEEGEDDETGDEGMSSAGEFEDKTMRGGWVEREPVDKEALQAARKDHKRAVKEVQAKKRLDKIPKKVKRRAVKKGKVKK
jgi:RIO kinase 1